MTTLSYKAHKITIKLNLYNIGVASIAKFRTCGIGIVIFKGGHLLWYLLPVVNVNCSQRKEFAPSGGKFFSLREAPILRRDAIEENHCLTQKSPFNVRYCSSILASQLYKDPKDGKM